MAAEFHESLPTPTVSFVIPCLNERATLPLVLRRIAETASGELSSERVEIVVVDNGSVDGSAVLAEALGATVVHCSERGYGAALQMGIRCARGEMIVFADADNTYDFRESGRLIEKLREGYDLVLGSRLHGDIQTGAMPFLHRYLGTPVLTSLINTLYGSRENCLTDCNSGFRCFRRTAFAEWGVKSPGMEFASELLIKALRRGSRVAEVPVSLAPSPKERKPHLNTWRDGMRHLLEILRRSPESFLGTGVLIWGVSWIVLALSLLLGLKEIGGVHILGPHTALLSSLGTMLGASLFGVGLILSTRSATPPRPYAWLLSVGEDRLFWGGVSFFSSVLLGFLLIVFSWMHNDFRFLAAQHETMFLMTLGADGLFLFTHLIAARMIQRPW